MTITYTDRNMVLLLSQEQTEQSERLRDLRRAVAALEEAVARMDQEIATLQAAWLARVDRENGNGDRRV